jgi:hypothetical protein
MASMGYSGARGKLIHEKNLKLKIACQTPFDIFLLPIPMGWTSTSVWRLTAEGGTYIADYRVYTTSLLNTAKQTGNQIHSPWLGDKVDSGIGRSYRSASLCSLGGPVRQAWHSWLYPSRQGLRIGPRPPSPFSTVILSPYTPHRGGEAEEGKPGGQSFGAKSHGKLTKHGTFIGNHCLDIWAS